MHPLPRPDLAIFDIDGTLLATDAFWLDLGLAAVNRVYRAHGIQEPPPAEHRFLEAMGLPMRAFWEHVLPAAHHALAEEVEAEAQELEQVAFGQGLGAMYPGARPLLADLPGAGVDVALASNCGRRYLESFLDAFDLRAIVREAYCADTPGIGSKADMVRDILQATAAKRAVFVGDRGGDRDAARAHRVPFILFTGGFGPAPTVNGDRVAKDYGEVRRMLLGD
jgi:phosphoglycolate phosphatase-like HAD superfamily hydrolase